MKLAFAIIFLVPLCLSAQDITGVWKGYLRTPGSKLDYELAISETGKKLSGYSLIIYPKDGIENIGIKKAKIKQGKKDIIIEDGELVYDNFTTPPIRTKMFANLSLTIKDSLMFLRGSFSTRSLDFRDTRTYEGEIFLERMARPMVTKMIVTLDEINFPHDLSFQTIKGSKRITTHVEDKKTPVTNPVAVTPIKPADRKIEKQSEIFFSNDSLILNLYDNGTIDGDTISIVLNGKIIAEKVALTARAHKLVIPSNIRQGDSLILIMHAESLGLIPPNSGLLIIEDGTTRHEIRFAGDLQKSAAIVLTRKNRL